MLRHLLDPLGDTSLAWYDAGVYRQINVVRFGMYMERAVLPSLSVMGRSIISVLGEQLGGSRDSPCGRAAHFQLEPE